MLVTFEVLGVLKWSHHYHSTFSLQEEPGGQRALIFDQGNRISQVKYHGP